MRTEITEIGKNLPNYDLFDVGSRTKCWQQFQIVCEKGTKNRVFSTVKPDFCFVKCKICDKIYVYASTFGTSTLNRHKCKGIDKNNNEESVEVANTEQKERVNQKLMIACIKDSRPFEFAAGEGFLEFVQELIDVAQNSDYRIDAKTLIWHPTTISRNIHGIKIQCSKTLSNILLDLENDGIGISFSCDIWTDGTNKVSL